MVTAPSSRPPNDTPALTAVRRTCSCARAARGRRRASWSQPMPRGSDFFGYWVSLDGNRVLVRAWGDDMGAPFRTPTAARRMYSCARAARGPGGQARRRPMPRAPTSSATRVSLDGNHALVGAYRDDDAGSDSGSAYVFVRAGSAWTQEDKLVATDPTEFDRFGWSCRSRATTRSSAPTRTTAWATAVARRTCSRARAAHGRRRPSSSQTTPHQATTSASRCRSRATRARRGAPRRRRGHRQRLRIRVRARRRHVDAGDQARRRRRRIGDRFGQMVSLSDNPALVGAVAPDINGFGIVGAAYVFVLPNVYVDATASGAGDGSSWADAFTDLQSALASAGDHLGGQRHLLPRRGTGQTDGAVASTFALRLWHRPPRRLRRLGDRARAARHRGQLHRPLRGYRPERHSVEQAYTWSRQRHR